MLYIKSTYIGNTHEDTAIYCLQMGQTRCFLSQSFKQSLWCICLH